MDNHEFRIKNDSLLAYVGYGIDVVIPDSVTKISGAAFKECTVQSISIPNSVTEIGIQAFSYCEHLQNLNIPAAVLEIGEEAFWNCISLEAIDVSIENPRYSSEDGVLYNKEKTKLLRYPPARRKETFVIPADVTEIASYAFQGCRYLKHVTVPSGVKPSPEMFAWCDSLECAVLCDGVKKIESFAFEHCKNLQYVCIPDSVEEIGEFSFEKCTGLKRIVLPENVKAIGRKAFYGCDLEEVAIPESVRSIGEKAFGYWRGTLWEFRYHLIIRGKKGSVAEQYADANNFHFVWISLNPDLMKRTLLLLFLLLFPSQAPTLPFQRRKQNHGQIFENVPFCRLSRLPSERRHFVTMNSFMPE